MFEKVSSDSSNVVLKSHHCQHLLVIDLKGAHDGTITPFLLYLILLMQMSSVIVSNRRKIFQIGVCGDVHVVLSGQRCCSVPNEGGVVECQQMLGQGDIVARKET